MQRGRSVVIAESRDKAEEYKNQREGEALYFIQKLLSVAPFH